MELRFDTTDKKRIELHCHTNMSKMAGVDNCEDIFSTAEQQMNISAMAVTDAGSVQAFPSAHAVSMGGEMKVIYGTEMIMRRERCDKGWNCPVPENIVLLARNDDGVRDMFHLLTEGFKRDDKYPAVLPEEIEKRRENILVGLSCDSVMKEMSSAPDEEDGLQSICRLMDLYDYIEIQPPENMVYEGSYNLPEWRDIIKKIIESADVKGIPVVAVSNAFFLNPADQVIYESLTLHDRGKPDRRPLYLRTTGEMMASFSFLGEETMEKVVFENPEIIAGMCNVENPLSEDEYFLHLEDENERLKGICEKRAGEIYGDVLPGSVRKRLDQELDAVEERGAAAFFLTGYILAEESLHRGFRTFSNNMMSAPFIAFLCRMTNINPLPAHYHCTECGYLEFASGGEADHITDGTGLKEKICPECGRKLISDGFNIPSAWVSGFDVVPPLYERELRLDCADGVLDHLKLKLEETFGRENVLESIGCVDTVSNEEAISYLMDLAKQYGDIDSIDIKHEIHKRFGYGIDKMTHVKRTSAGSSLYYILPDGTDADRITPQESGSEAHLEGWFLDGKFNAVDLFRNKVLDKLNELETLTGAGAADITFDDRNVQGLFNGDVTFGEKRNEALPATVGIYEFENKHVRRLLKENHPERFSELVRINAQKNSTFKNEKYKKKLSDLPVCFEELYHYLTGRGIPCSDAFEISDTAGNGRRLYPAQVEKLRKYGVSDEYINACNDTVYLFSRGSCAENVTIAWMMAFYKMYYPESFYKVACKYGREYEDHNRVADAVRRNPDCLKKAVYLTDFSELLSEAEMRGVRPEELIGLLI